MVQLELIEKTYEDGYVPTRGKGSFKPIKYIVNREGCWVCISHAKSKDRGNYPVIDRGGRQKRMSRYIFEIENGFIDDSLYVMHSCDNPECINPKHLSMGTTKENTQDMIIKKRKPIGERVVGSKLTESQVISIFNDSRGCTSIAKEYGVSKKTILNIRQGKTWKHLGLLELKGRANN